MCWPGANPLAWSQHNRPIWSLWARLSSLNKDVCLQRAVAFSGQNIFAWHRIKPFDLSQLPSGLSTAHQQLGHWLCNHHSARSAPLLPSLCTNLPTVALQWDCPRSQNPFSFNEVLMLTVIQLHLLPFKQTPNQQGPLSNTEVVFMSDNVGKHKEPYDVFHLPRNWNSELGMMPHSSWQCSICKSEKARWMHR